MRAPSRLSLFLFLGACAAAPESDRIEDLPLYGAPPTPHYSGYLDGTDGCNTEVNGDYCGIHYWFTAAQGDSWLTKPVVLWLNGGPGSSSILGLLQEVGPLLMNSTGGLMENPYSWNTVANLFVIESPVGVGYSYCQAQEQGQVCQNTDKYTASTARAAVLDFFSKFPELKSNDFFITGESYAGVYIPTLAYELLQHNQASKNDDDAIVNLRGLAIGDPCTDNTAQAESMDPLWYAHKNGLVDDAIYETLLSDACSMQKAPAPMKLSDKESWIRHHLTSRIRDSPECTLALRKFLLSSSRGLSQGWKDLFIDDYSLFGPATSVEDEAMQAYMNRPDVKKALHVEKAPIGQWPYPEAGFDYTKEYDACTFGEYVDPEAVSMIDFYQKVVPKLNVVFVYNGDTDPCVSYEGTRTAVKRVGFGELDGGGYRPWFYNHTAAPLKVVQEKAVMFGPDLLLQPTGAQFGGEVVNYENGLSFLTIHGSGHMVPQFRPQAALHMFSKLLAYEDLSPLLPSNVTLSSMSNSEFAKVIDTWTESAQTALYIENHQERKPARK